MVDSDSPQLVFGIPWQLVLALTCLTCADGQIVGPDGFIRLILFSLDKRQFGKKQVLLSIMTTQAYYKDRLGFDPNDPKEMSSLDPTLHGYEENLTKFKGLLSDFF